MSVEKRQKEQEKTSMVVEGFLFANEAEAAQARKEAEGVKYVKEKAQMDDPEMVLRIYNKMIQQRLFDTAVGYSYLKDLQEYLQSIPFIRKEDIFPIPVQHPQVEESLRKAKRVPAPKPKTQTVVKMRTTGDATALCAGSPLFWQYVLWRCLQLRRRPIIRRC